MYNHTERCCRVVMLFIVGIHSLDSIYRLQSEEKNAYVERYCLHMELFCVILRASYSE